MSNGIGKNPLTDISKVYLQQVANEGTMDIKGFAIPKSEQDAAKKRVQDKTKKKQIEKGISSAGYTKEGLDPVNPVAVKKKFANRKDRDLDNDGDTDSSDKYLHKRRKAIAGAMKKRMSEGVRDMDPEKGTAERKARLEKKRGMKLDDHPQFKKEEVENVEEIYKGKHGQTDKQYADSRSSGGKMVSGDSKGSGAEYTHGRRVKAENPGMQPDVGGKTKPKSQGRMDSGTRADLQYRKANLKAKMAKEGFSNWRTDLSEVMTDEIDSKPVKEKKINNKIKINPKLGEAVEALGGEILEVTEVDEAVYGGTPAKKEEPKDNRMVVTAADKKGNTPAYQRMKAGDKRYKAADHMKEGIGDKLKGAVKAVKKGVEQERKFQRASGETVDRMKRMARHKQDKYGPSTLKQRLKTGAEHNTDNEKKAKMNEASFKKIQEKLNLKKTQWGV